MLLDVFPGHLLLGTFEREDHVAVFIFRIDDIDRNFLPHLQRFALLSGQLFQFTTRDDAFGLGADADKDLAGTDAGNRASADLARLRQVDVEILFIAAATPCSDCLRLLFSLLTGIAPLSGQGFILICHLRLRLRKM